MALPVLQNSVRICVPLGEGKCKEIAMRRVLRFVLWGLIGVVALVGVLGALLGYSGYSPAPEVPRLSGTLTRGNYDGGRTEADVPDLRAAGDWQKERRSWW
jgi:hypothetical protein